MKRFYFGCIELGFAQACVGVNMVVSKQATMVMPIYPFLVIRYFILAMVLLLVSVSHAKLAGEKLCYDFSGKEWATLFVQALCANFLFNIFIMSGLSLTSASAAGIITSAYPAVLACLAFFFLKERMSKIKIMSIAIAVLGLTSIALGTQYSHANGNNLFGDLLVFIALIPTSLYTIFTKYMGSKIKPLTSAIFISLISIAFYLPLAIYQMNDFDWSGINKTQVLLILLSMVLSAAFYLNWPKGLQHVPANTSALFVGTMPIAAVVAAHFILGESLTVYDLFGLVCVVASIVIGLAVTTKGVISEAPLYAPTKS